MNHSDLDAYLQEVFSSEEASEPYALNGMQISAADPDREISHIGFAVTANEPTLIEARDLGCDALVVHHGLIWRTGIRSVDTRLMRKLSLLSERNTSVHAWHLPLDRHSEVGNSAILARKTGLQEQVSDDLLCTGLWTGSHAELVRSACQACDRTAPVYDLPGLSEPRHVAVCTGNGGSQLARAFTMGVDVLLTGEISLDAWHEAQEYGMGLVALGHHDTETHGVRALQGLLARDFPSLQLSFLPEVCPV